MLWLDLLVLLHPLCARRHEPDGWHRTAHSHRQANRPFGYALVKWSERKKLHESCAACDFPENLQARAACSTWASCAMSGLLHIPTVGLLTAADVLVTSLAKSTSTGPAPAYGAAAGYERAPLVGSRAVAPPGRGHGAGKARLKCEVQL
jgi:hypothetical protein